MTDREKLIELLMQKGFGVEGASIASDHLLANGVTVQQWIPVSEPPKENDWYMCWVMTSAIGKKEKWEQKLCFWEDDCWLKSDRSFVLIKPTHWMPLPEPPEEE